MNLSKPTGYANPLDVAQAPDHLALGFATNLDLPGEQKYFPFASVNKPPFKPRPTCNLDPLPTFPFGVVPIYPHQQNSDLRLRGKDMPNVMYNGSMISADLAEAFAMLEDKGKRVPAPLSDAYVGSPWDYSPREGRPFGTTDGNNFVLEYHQAMREKELHRRIDSLIREGYDEKRIARVMEEEVDNTIRKKLYHK